ncbi:MAG TPA: hypothetical protein VJ998_05795 [Pseudomonadales bacterium]|nr:hypothetical protein [Pseudomonadales bacterium]
MAQTCPRCLKVLPKKWQRELKDGTYVHTCGARLEPLVPGKWPHVLGVLVTLLCPALLGLAGYHGTGKQYAAVVIGAIFGLIIAEYTSRPVLAAPGPPQRDAKARE